MTSDNREYVNACYRASELKHEREKTDPTSKYTHPNQKEDAHAIIQLLHSGKLVVSIQKKTKIGMDGLMIELQHLATTHPDDSFVFNYKNTIILTGMSNTAWSNQMKEKLPSCFSDQVYHHGQLMKSKLHESLKNCFIIIDEIDVASGKDQRLSQVLKESKILDIEFMKKNNNRIIFTSATMMKQLYDLADWGDLHANFKMTIPPEYIGHEDFLNMGILKDSYPLKNKEGVERWVTEDILQNYGDEFRIHFVRITKKSSENLEHVCKINGIKYLLHNSIENMYNDGTFEDLFESTLTSHIVICVKGFLRRANLIENKHKVKIGALMEEHTKKVDNNVQIQGLVGRMTGYWRTIVESGHKTGPFRCSLDAVQEYISTYNDPFGSGAYQCAKFVKKDNVIKTDHTMLDPEHIGGFEPRPAPVSKVFVRRHKEFDTFDEMETFAKTVHEGFRNTPFKMNKDGFFTCSTSGTNLLQDYESVSKLFENKNNHPLSNLPKPKVGELKVGEKIRRKYVFYRDIHDKKSIKFAMIWAERTV